MPIFIKTEQFTSQTKKLPAAIRKQYIHKHLSWIKHINESGIKICSGYLIDGRQMPGGGGVLILEASSFIAAKDIIEKDPIIQAGLVTWSLHEWKSVFGNLALNINVGIES